MRKNVSVKENYVEMSREAADVMRSVIKRNPTAVIVIATGHSPQLAYRFLTAGLMSDHVDVSRVTFVKLDEWMGLGEKDTATCEYFIQKELLEPLCVKAENYLGFHSEVDDEQKECKRIEEAYAKLASIDLVVLGIGMNGHLGLNEPGDELTGSVHCIKLDPKTQTHEMLSHAQGKVEFGITLGMENLFRGEQILLLADGTDKEIGLEYYLNDVITTQIPVSLLKLHPNCKCIVNGESFRDLVHKEGMGYEVLWNNR